MSKKVHSFTAYMYHAVYIMEVTLTDGSKVYDVEVTETSPDGVTNTVSLQADDLAQAHKAYSALSDIIQAGAIKDGAN